MARPSLDDKNLGLTTSEVAKQLRCSTSYVRVLVRRGYFPPLKDGGGNFRFHPHDVVDVARKLGRAVETDGEIEAKVYGYFLRPGFEATPKAIAQIVHETKVKSDIVIALYAKYKMGVGAADAQQAVREAERIEQEFDEQIAALERDLAHRTRPRASFIPGDKDPPPNSSR
jgi:excisionase family DNA binding protein